MFYIYTSSYSFNLFLSRYSFLQLPVFLSFIILIAFSVKLPVYGLHFWLPMAHVEAPTFGSIILAGVLLKLGGVGLVRLSRFLSFDFLISTFLRYLFIFLFFVTLICCFQTDFKRLVAYSSVSHMIAVPLLFFSNNLLAHKSLLILIFFHGLRSPVLFILVGVLYSYFSSRQLVVIRGLLLISPLISFIMVLAFFFTISAPPFPSFVAEVYFFVSSYVLSSYFIYSVILFTFFSLVYNLLWFRIINFSSTSIRFSLDKVLSFNSFLALSHSFLVCFSFLVLLSYM
jgi:NADH:ubiquinone oxidoreductase subunit 4 (subunit M)